MRRLLVHYEPGESSGTAKGDDVGESDAAHLKVDGVQADTVEMLHELFDTLGDICRYGERRFRPDAVHDDSSVYAALFDIRAHLRAIRATMAALDQFGISDPNPSARKAGAAVAQVAAGATVTMDALVIPAADAETSIEKVCLPSETRAIVARHLAPLILMKFEIPYRLNLQELLLYLLEIGEGKEASSSELYTWMGATEKSQRSKAAFAFRRSMPMLANRGLIDLLPVSSHKTKRFALKKGAIGTLDRELLRVNLQRAAIEVAGKAKDPRVTAEVVMSFFQTLLETPTVMTILDALRDAPMVSVERQDPKTAGEIEAMVPIHWPPGVVRIVMKELLSKSLLQYGFMPTPYHLALCEFLLLKGEGAVSPMSELLDWYLPMNAPRLVLDAAKNSFYYAMRALQTYSIVQVVHGTVNQFMLMPGKLPQVEGAWRAEVIRRIVDLADQYLSPPFTIEWLTRELEANRSLPELVVALTAPQMVPAEVKPVAVPVPVEPPEEPAAVAEAVPAEAVAAVVAAVVEAVVVAAEDEAEVVAEVVAVAMAEAVAPVEADETVDAAAAPVPVPAPKPTPTAPAPTPAPKPTPPTAPRPVPRPAPAPKPAPPTAPTAAKPTPPTAPTAPKPAPTAADRRARTRRDELDEEDAALTKRIEARKAAKVTLPDYVVKQLTDLNHPIHKYGEGKPFRLHSRFFRGPMEVYKLLPENDQLPPFLLALGRDSTLCKTHHVLLYFEGGDVGKSDLRLLHKSEFNPDNDCLPFQDDF